MKNQFKSLIFLFLVVSSFGVMPSQAENFYEP